MKKILSGVIASKGKAEGEVFVVDKSNKVNMFPKGKILVTEMTNPAFVPAMIKAKAILTDIGGITCHAAIVSRELGVPCIVGLKDATKKLKSGQVVIVDAEKGDVYVK
jgi:pyruvate, water dikinase